MAALTLSDSAFFEFFQKFIDPLDERGPSLSPTAIASPVPASLPRLRVQISIAKKHLTDLDHFRFLSSIEGDALFGPAAQSPSYLQILAKPQMQFEVSAM